MFYFDFILMILLTFLSFQGQEGNLWFSQPVWRISRHCSEITGHSFFFKSIKISQRFRTIFRVCSFNSSTPTRLNYFVLTFFFLLKKKEMMLVILEAFRPMSTIRIEISPRTYLRRTIQNLYWSSFEPPGILSEAPSEFLVKELFYVLFFKLQNEE